MSVASLTEQAYYTIRDLILRGKLPLGSALSRRRLAAGLGMSLLPVSEAIQESWADPANQPRIKANPESVRVFLPGGKPPLEGDLFRNPGMARAMRLVAEKGPDG